MNFKKFLTLSLTFILMITLLASFIQAEPQKKDQKKEQKAQSVVPKDIKALLEQGLTTRQGKPDIPFQFIDTYVLPAKGTYIAIFVTKIKNASLEYAAPTTDPENYKTDVDMFIQFYRNDGGNLKLLAENKTTSSFAIPASEYNSEAENYYYLGFPLQAGKYLLAAALGNRATRKLGTTYYEFEIPNLEEAAKNGKLETTTLFLLKNYEQMDTQELYPNFKKDYFSWMILKAYPYPDNKLKPGDQPTLMFMIYGVKPDESGHAQVEINFDIRKDNNKIVAYTPMKYDSPFIEQPIPIPTTKKMKITDDKGERLEDRPLEAGTYEIVMNIKDAVSGLTLEKRIPIELIVQ